MRPAYNSILLIALAAACGCSGSFEPATDDPEARAARTAGNMLMANALLHEGARRAATSLECSGLEHVVDALVPLIVCDPSRNGVLVGDDRTLLGGFLQHFSDTDAFDLSFPLGGGQATLLASKVAALLNDRRRAVLTSLPEHVAPRDNGTLDPVTLLMGQQPTASAPVVSLFVPASLAAAGTSVAATRS